MASVHKRAVNTRQSPYICMWYLIRIVAGHVHSLSYRARFLLDQARTLIVYAYIILSVDIISYLNKEISNNMVCATRKASDQPAHTRSLIRAFASRLGIL